MATRTKTETAKNLNTSAPEPEVTTSETEFSATEYLRSMAASLGVEIPSGKKLLIAAITGIVVGLVGGYLGSQLAGYALVGALLLTGSSLIAFLAWLLAFAVTAYVACIAASRASMYIAAGQLEKDFDRARGWVRSVFKRSAKNEGEVSHA